MFGLGQKSLLPALLLLSTLLNSAVFGGKIIFPDRTDKSDTVFGQDEADKAVGEEEVFSAPSGPDEASSSEDEGVNLDGVLKPADRGIARRRKTNIKVMHKTIK